MTLWALSDLHVGYEENRATVAAMAARPEDWLILAGDTGETPAHLDFVLKELVPRFAHVIWTPGNHDLWTPPQLAPAQRGVAHYERLVALCRSYGVDTPEDPFPIYKGEGGPAVVASAFTLYDYSFRPEGVSREDAIDWAADEGLRATDEALLAPDPYPTRDAWCHARVAYTEARLAEIPADARIVLVDHYPLRRDLAVLPRIPRFSIWCGTTLTESWTTRFPIDIVVSGHLHMRSTRWRDGVRFEEVSLGYPRPAQWRSEAGADAYLRRILPAPEPVPEGWGRDETVIRYR